MNATGTGNVVFTFLDAFEPDTAKAEELKTTLLKGVRQGFSRVFGQ